MYLKNINFKNKQVLVTGAGKATVIGMAEAGGHIFAMNRTKADLDKLANIINKTNGKITKIVCDVTDYFQVVNCVKKN